MLLLLLCSVGVVLGVVALVYIIDDVTRPFPPGLSIFDSVVLKTELSFRLLEQLSAKFRSSSVCSFWVGLRRFYLVVDPRLAHSLLSGPNAKMLVKSNAYSGVQPLLGQGLFMTEGSLWSLERQICGAAFSPKPLERVVSVSADLSKKLVSCWHRLDEGHYIDAHEDMKAICLDIVTSSLYDFDMSDFFLSRQVSFPQVLTALRVACSESITPSFWDYIPFLRKLFLHQSPIYQESVQLLHQLTDAILNHTGSHTDPTVVDQSQDSDSKISLLTRLRQSNSLTEQQIRHMVLTFIVAGHSDPASCLSFTLFLIASHQNVQSKLHQVVDKYMEGRNETRDTLSFSNDLKGLEYLEQVIKESLRIYPPIGLMGRRVANKGFTIEGCSISKGSELLICPWVYHRSPVYFRDPLEFNPDRFQGGNPKEQGVYMPFSEGARFCIGRTYAMLEIKVILATILANFKMSLLPDYQLNLGRDIGMCPANGLPLRLTPR